MLFPLIDENPTRRWPIVTVGLITINTLLLLASLGLSPLEHNRLFLNYGFVPQRLTQALDGGKPVVIDLGKLFERDRDAQQLLANRPEGAKVQLSGHLSAAMGTIFTSMFLHAGLAHLVGNMWFLWLFGNNVEDRLGHLPFLLFYLLGGVFASLCHWLFVSVDGALVPTVGASGAVAVTLGAYAITYPTARVRCLLFVVIIFLFVDLPAVVVLGLWLLGQIVSGLGALHLGIDGGVAWWAHIGGFVFGMGVMPLLWLVIPDTTYRSVLSRERAMQYRPPRDDRFRF